MLVDFHIHYFPDSIARETVEKLAKEAMVEYYGDGTFANLLETMKKDGVDISVNQPVATKPEQVTGINRKMVQMHKTGAPVVFFGSMHPGFSNSGEELSFLRENGIKGIKMHPEYQEFYPDDARMAPIYEACVRNDIILFFHSGVDLGYKTVHGTPEKFSELVKIRGLKFVLAHMGAYRMWDGVEKYLAGKNVYFDTSYCYEMENKQFSDLIINHGADKILFGSDFPWEKASRMRLKIEGLGLSEEIREKIYYKNAVKLLGLKL